MEDQKPPSLLDEPPDRSGAIHVQPGREAILGALLISHPWVRRAVKVVLVGAFALVTIIGGWYFDAIKDGQERTYTGIQRVEDKLDAMRSDIHDVQTDGTRRDGQLDLLDLRIKGVEQTLYQIQQATHSRAMDAYDDRVQARSTTTPRPP